MFAASTSLLVLVLQARREGVGESGKARVFAPATGEACAWCKLTSSNTDSKCSRVFSRPSKCVFLASPSKLGFFLEAEPAAGGTWRQRDLHPR